MTWQWLDHLNFTEYLLPVVIGAVAPLVRHARQRVQESRAASWPAADAVVQSASVKQPGGQVVEIGYRYYALAEYRYGKYQRHFRKKSEAEEFAGAVRGLTLPVRYRPDNPAASIMVERDLQMAGLVAGSMQMG